MTIFEAIKDRWDNCPGLGGSALGPLSMNPATEAANLPYAVMVPLGNARETTTTEAVYDRLDVQFSLFYEEFDPGDGYLRAFRAQNAFADSVALKIGNGWCLMAREKSQNFIRQDDGGHHEVWMCQIDVSFTLKRTRY